MKDTLTYELRYLSGDRKIMAIKLVRELSGLGLAEAKAVVEQQQVFARGLEHAAAMAIVARFADEAGSQVEVFEEAEYLYAFDPRHPQRGDQPVVRLCCHASCLAWERGQLGEWTREHEQIFADVAERNQAIADERERWIGQGLEVVASELELVQRASAREPQLEQAIRESGWADDALTVYADWLQRHGDPRGLVSALDLARAREPEQREALDRAFAEALQQHRVHLFGPLRGVETYVCLRWRAGLVIGIEYDHGGRELWPSGDLDLLTNLLALPICACLESLCMRSAAISNADLAAMLANADPAMLAGLRELTLSDPFLGDGFNAWAYVPALERLEMYCSAARWLRLTKLRDLDLTFWWPEAAVELLHDSELPSLRKLTLRFDSQTYHGEWLADSDPDTFRQLLDLPVVGSLQTLVLSHDGEPWPLWVAQELLGAKRLHGIECVDLRGAAFEADALARLSEARELRPGLLLAGWVGGQASPKADETSN